MARSVSGQPSHPQPGESADLSVRNERDEINQAEEWVLDALTRQGYPEASRFAIRLALEEALANAFRHGHKSLPPEVPVRLEVCVGPREVVLAIQDSGPGFHPEEVPDPRLLENIERPTGRGLFLMRAYMSSVEYEGKGNRVKMVYRIPDR